jgi:hypothetical protein
MEVCMRAFSIGAVAAAILIPGLAAAQDVRVGVKGGVVSATLKTEGFEGLDPEAGAGGAVGGFIDFGAARVVGFRPEVLVTWRRFTLSDVAEDRRTGSTAVEVPLLLCLRTSNASGARGVFFVGPQLSFVTDVWQEVEGTRIDLDEAIKGSDTGITFGGGVDVPAGRGAFVLDARVIIGLRNLWEEAGATVKSRAFAAMLGYRF